MVSSINSMGYGNMNMNSAGASGGSNNMHQQLKEKYGVGYEDFNTAPYARPYPFSMTARIPEAPRRESLIRRFVKFWHL